MFATSLSLMVLSSSCNLHFYFYKHTSEHRLVAFVLMGKDAKRNAKKRLLKVQPNGESSASTAAQLVPLRKIPVSIKVEKRRRQAAESNNIHHQEDEDRSSFGPHFRASGIEDSQAGTLTVIPGLSKDGPRSCINDEWQTTSNSWSKIAPLMSGYKKSRIWMPFYYDGMSVCVWLFLCWSCF